LNCEPKECIVFEDALNGVKAAKAGGFYTMCIGEPEVLSEADKVYASLTSVNFKMLELLS
jgi:beta-phosphoglucomutase